MAKNVMRIVALCFALFGIACASILLVFAEQEISPYTATFDRLSIATIIFLIGQVVSRVSDQQVDKSNTGGAALQIQSIFFPLKLSPTDIGLLVTSGIAFSGSLNLWAWSLTQTSVANSTLLNNMMPIFTTIGAWVFLREAFSPRFLVGMCIAIFGAIWIGLEDLQITNGLIGDEAALGAALLAAINILSVEQLRKRFDTFWIMLWTSLIGSLFTLLILLAINEQFFPKTLVGWAAVILLATLSQALGQGLLTYSLKKFSAGFVAVSMLSIPLIAALLAMVIFGERLTVLNWCAFGVVLFGMYISISAQASQSTPEIEAQTSST